MTESIQSDLSKADVELTAQAQDLTSLVEYAKNSVVSRTITDKTAGTVTVFAFDAGQGLSEHQAPFDATVVVLDGAACITIGGEEVRARAGQIVIMPANVPHAVRAEEPFKMMLIMIKQE
ncbi:MAG: cupin domain-containing protein [Planctomycetota bacterium]|nr:MAG: cupin domain-containing protein [Planctomycetota bacterium]